MQSEPAESRSRFNVVNVLVAAGVGVCALALLAVWFGRVIPPHRGSNCKNNLKQLGLGLILYRDNQGRGQQYPAEDGADLLIKLWDSGVTQEPDLFLCPSTEDDNAEGAGLVLGGTAPHACSYAGRRNRNQARYPGMFSAVGTSETAQASDDLEGDVEFNHGDAVIVLFVDGHVEEVTLHPLRDPRITVEAFGQGGLLDPLAN